MLEQGVRETIVDEIRARRLVLFIGAGVTIQATGRTDLGWTGLIQNGLKFAVKCGREDASMADHDLAALTKLQLDTERLLDLAENVVRKLKIPDDAPWRNWLTSLFSDLTASKSDITGSIAQLADLGVPIITTNYDSLLTEDLRRERVLVKQSDRIADVFRGNRSHAVIHLHGHWEEPESLILGVRSYEQLLANDFGRFFLNSVAFSQTILFVGCGDGLHDPNVGRLFDWLRRNVPGANYRHYRLVREAELVAITAQHPIGNLVKVVSYGTEFGDLSAALRQLAEAAQPPEIKAKPWVGNVTTPDICVGRDQELGIAGRLISANRRSLVLLRGSLGIGKTNLALQIAGSEIAVSRFGTRRWIVSLDTATDAAETVKAIADTIGLISPTVDIKDLCAGLNEQPSLIVLDNFETPWEGSDSPAVEKLLTDLSRAENLSVIVTKRGAQPPEGLRWDYSIELDPLSLGDDVRLFTELSGHPMSSPGLVQLMRELDGVPLAIRLVARRAIGSSVAEIYEAWKERGHELARRPNTTLSRLNSLERSVDMSLNSLGVTVGRTLFSLLGQLPAGISVEDREHFMEGAGFEAAQELRNAGLGYRRGERLILLSPIRDKACRDHRPFGAHEFWHEHYLQLVKEKGAKLGFTGGVAALARLRPELPNIEAAIRRGLELGSVGSVTSVARGYGRLLRFAGPGSLDPLKAMAEQMLGRAGSEPEPLVSAGVCWLQFAHVLLQRVEHNDARLAYRRARDIFEQSGHSKGIAKCLIGEADVALAQNAFSEAKRAYHAALRACRAEAGRDAAACYRGLGDVALAVANGSSAKAAYQKALRLYLLKQDLLGAATCMEGLANVERNHNRFATAVDHYESAAAQFREAGVQQGTARCVKGLADVSRHQCNNDTSEDQYVEAQKLFRELGDSRGEATCIEGLGLVFLARSELVQAGSTLARALQTYRKLGDRQAEATCTKNIGDVHRERAAYDEAEERYRTALELSDEGHLLHRANCFKALGDLELCRNNARDGKRFDDAQTFFGQAEHLYMESGNRRGFAYCLKSKGDLALSLGQLAEARRAYRTAHELHKDMRDKLGVANCFEGLGDVAFIEKDFAAANEAFDVALSNYRRAESAFGIANCEQRQGMVAYELNDYKTAKAKWTGALSFLSSGADPYALGWVHARLAKVVKGRGQKDHIRSARTAWASIGRLDLMSNLE